MNDNLGGKVNTKHVIQQQQQQQQQQNKTERKWDGITLLTTNTFITKETSYILLSPFFLYFKC